MFCVWCGSKVADDASFCSECGMAVWSEDTKQTDNMIEEMDIRKEVKEETSDENLAAVEISEYTPSNEILNVLQGIRAGIIVLIILLIIFIILYYSATGYYFKGMGFY